MKKHRLWKVLHPKRYFYLGFLGECVSKVPEGNCTFIGSECWCYHEGGYAIEVCGHPNNYNGSYYSLSFNSSNSESEIIHGLGKKLRKTCAGKPKCISNAAVNTCFTDAKYADECGGAGDYTFPPRPIWHIYSDYNRWAPTIYGKNPGIVRCDNMEG